jgi:predicted DCC family thiol-disulfide oxidoreductase YuxK
MTPAALGPHPVVLFDGLCPMCNGAVTFLLRRDTAVRFRFAPLQSAYAAEVLARHGLTATDLDTVCLLQGEGTDDEQVLVRSDAVAGALRGLGGGWALLGGLLAAVPRPLRNLGYDLIARNRRRISGAYEACPVIPAAWRARFLHL